MSSLRSFCEGPLKGAKFQLREVKQVAPNVMFFRASLIHPSFKTHRNRVLFSQAISVKLALDSYKIFRDVQSTFRFLILLVVHDQLTYFLPVSTQLQADCCSHRWKVMCRLFLYVFFSSHLHCFHHLVNTSLVRFLIDLVLYLFRLHAVQIGLEQFT